VSRKGIEADAAGRGVEAVIIPVSSFLCERKCLVQRRFEISRFEPGETGIAASARDANSRMHSENNWLFPKPAINSTRKKRAIEAIKLWFHKI